jgi:hypothetical protein
MTASVKGCCFFIFKADKKKAFDAKGWDEDLYMAAA